MLILTLMIVVLAQVPDTRSTYELWVAAAAILTTIASSLLLYIPRDWPTLGKQAVVVGVSGVFSAADLYFAGQFDTADWGRTTLLVFLGATGIYVVIWRPLSEAVKDSAL